MLKETRDAEMEKCVILKRISEITLCFSKEHWGPLDGVLKNFRNVDNRFIHRRQQGFRHVRKERIGVRKMFFLAPPIIIIRGGFDGYNVSCKGCLSSPLRKMTKPRHGYSVHLHH